MEDRITAKSVYDPNKTKRIVLTGLLFAIAIILSIVESMLPPIITAAPGIKLGLSNIIVMYILIVSGKRQAYTIAVLKSAFVVATRGYIAGIFSLSGGLLSLTIMILLMLLFKERVSYLVLSIAGAVFHNIGQLILLSLLFTNLFAWFYMPVLVISGVIAGIITATLLRFVMPELKKLSVSNKKQYGG